MSQIISDPEYKLEKLNKGKVSYFWDSYNIVKFTEHGGAWTSAKGSFHKGKYGYKEVIEVNSDGKWILDK